jgi:hypothetical protein
MSCPRIALLLAILLVASVVPASPDDPAPLFCTDIMTIPRSSLLLAWKLRNSPELLLDHQRVCTTDDASPGFAKCDWEYDLMDVGVLRPQPGTVLRLVATGRTHVTGTGTHGTIDALECRQNRLVEVFSAAESFVKSASPTSFVVASRVWVNDDAMCCPSHERRTHFKWDGVAHTYVSTLVTYYKIDDVTRKRTKVPRPDCIDR